MPKTFTDEQKAEYREQRQSEARQALEDAMTALTTEDGFRRWVECRARTNYPYSFNNQLLIAFQCPQATMVAGFRKWKSVGRQVRKGEKAIKILAPTPFIIRDSSGAPIMRADGEPERRMWFKVVSVFDVSQTDGPDLEQPEAAPLDGDSHAHFLEPLIQYAKTIGYTVQFRDTGSAGGFCDYSQNLIAINNHRSPNHQVKTLVHELAHAKGVTYEYGKNVAEALVESIAWIVCRGLGLDTGAYSLGYIAGWSGTAGLEAVKTFAATVDEIAGELEAACKLDKSRKEDKKDAAA
jgi:antirestriction protein ArdC